MDSELEELVRAVAALVQQFPGVTVTHIAEHLDPPQPLQDQTTEAFLVPAKGAADLLVNHQDDPQGLREPLIDAARDLVAVEYNQAVDGQILEPLINRVKAALNGVTASN